MDNKDLCHKRLKNIFGKRRSMHSKRYLLDNVHWPTFKIKQMIGKSKRTKQDHAISALLFFSVLFCLFRKRSLSSMFTAHRGAAKCCRCGYQYAKNKTVTAEFKKKILKELKN